MKGMCYFIMKKFIFNALCSFLLLTALIGISAPCTSYAANPLPQGQPRKGIDVSKWNGLIDWNAVRNSGVEFAIIRTSFGWGKKDWDKQTDLRLRQNIDGARAAGIPIGAYHYSYATTVEQARAEAEFFIHCLAGTQLEYPVFFDFEDKCQLPLTNQQRTNIACAFLNEVRRAGYCVGIYANLNWINNKLDFNRLRFANYELWVAQWNDHCDCTYPYGIWQHTNKGSVDGINGDVDMDLCYADYPTYMRQNHLNGF